MLCRLVLFCLVLIAFFSLFQGQNTEATEPNYNAGLDVKFLVNETTTFPLTIAAQDVPSVVASIWIEGFIPPGATVTIQGPLEVRYIEAQLFFYPGAKLVMDQVTVTKSGITVKHPERIDDSAISRCPNLESIVAQRFPNPPPPATSVTIEIKNSEITGQTMRHQLFNRMLQVGIASVQICSTAGATADADARPHGLVDILITGNTIRAHAFTDNNHAAIGLFTDLNALSEVMWRKYIANVSSIVIENNKEVSLLMTIPDANFDWQRISRVIEIATSTPWVGVVDRLAARPLTSLSTRYPPRFHIRNNLNLSVDANWECMVLSMSRLGAGPTLVPLLEERDAFFPDGSGSGGSTTDIDLTNNQFVKASCQKQVMVVAVETALVFPPLLRFGGTATKVIVEMKGTDLTSEGGNPQQDGQDVFIIFTNLQTNFGSKVVHPVTGDSVSPFTLFERHEVAPADIIVDQVDIRVSAAFYLDNLAPRVVKIQSQHVRDVNVSRSKILFVHPTNTRRGEKPTLAKGEGRQHRSPQSAGLIVFTGPGTDPDQYRFKYRVASARHIHVSNVRLDAMLNGTCLHRVQFVTLGHLAVDSVRAFDNTFVYSACDNAAFLNIRQLDVADGGSVVVERNVQRNFFPREPSGEFVPLDQSGRHYFIGSDKSSATMYGFNLSTCIVRETVFHVYYPDFFSSDKEALGTFDFVVLRHYSMLLLLVENNAVATTAVKESTYTKAMNASRVVIRANSFRCEGGLGSTLCEFFRGSNVAMGRGGNELRRLEIDRNDVYLKAHTYTQFVSITLQDRNDDNGGGNSGGGGSSPFEAPSAPATIYPFPLSIYASSNRVETRAWTNRAIWNAFLGNSALAAMTEPTLLSTVLSFAGVDMPYVSLFNNSFVGSRIFFVSGVGSIVRTIEIGGVANKTCSSFTRDSYNDPADCGKGVECSAGESFQLGKKQLSTLVRELPSSDPTSMRVLGEFVGGEMTELTVDKFNGTCENLRPHTLTYRLTPSRTRSRTAPRTTSRSDSGPTDALTLTAQFWPSNPVAAIAGGSSSAVADLVVAFTPVVATAAIGAIGGVSSAARFAPHGAVTSALMMKKLSALGTAAGACPISSPRALQKLSADSNIFGISIAGGGGGSAGEDEPPLGTWRGAVVSALLLVVVVAAVCALSVAVVAWWRRRRQEAAERELIERGRRTSSRSSGRGGGGGRSKKKNKIEWGEALDAVRFPGVVAPAVLMSAPAAALASGGIAFFFSSAGNGAQNVALLVLGLGVLGIGPLVLLAIICGKTNAEAKVEEQPPLRHNSGDRVWRRGLRRGWWWLMKSDFEWKLDTAFAKRFMFMTSDGCLPGAPLGIVVADVATALLLNLIAGITSACGSSGCCVGTSVGALFVCVCHGGMLVAAHFFADASKFVVARGGRNRNSNISRRQIRNDGGAATDDSSSEEPRRRQVYWVRSEAGVSIVGSFLSLIAAVLIVASRASTGEEGIYDDPPLVGARTVSIVGQFVGFVAVLVTSIIPLAELLWDAVLSFRQRRSRERRVFTLRDYYGDEDAIERAREEDPHLSDFHRWRREQERERDELERNDGVNDLTLELHELSRRSTSTAGRNQPPTSMLAPPSPSSRQREQRHQPQQQHPQQHLPAPSASSFSPRHGHPSRPRDLQMLSGAGGGRSSGGTDRRAISSSQARHRGETSDNHTNNVRSSRHDHHTSPPSSSFSLSPPREHRHSSHRHSSGSRRDQPPQQQETRNNRHHRPSSSSSPSRAAPAASSSSRTQPVPPPRQNNAAGSPSSTSRNRAANSRDSRYALL